MSNKRKTVRFVYREQAGVCRQLGASGRGRDLGANCAMPGLRQREQTLYASLHGLKRGDYRYVLYRLGTVNHET